MIHGTLDLTNEEVPYYLELNDSFFDEDLILVNTHFTKSLQLQKINFNSLPDFWYTTIDGNFEASKVQFRPSKDKDKDKDGKLREMSFERMKVGGSVFLSEAVFDC